MTLKRWLQVCFFNLLIVATAGVVMRYKIMMPLSIVDQKNLLHGHSHFAFTGWITQVIMCLMINYLEQNNTTDAFKKFNWVLVANAATAYGMLISFIIQGYGPISIVFSTLSIFVSWWFAVQFWKDLNRLKRTTVIHSWFRSAVIFNALSSAGAFFLAWMFVTKNFDEHSYLASIYFFLHFQYNGWFFFGCMGLIADLLIRYNSLLEKKVRPVFYLFFISVFPAYFLSALWLPIPGWLYACIVGSVLLQLWAWLQLLFVFRSLKTLIYPEYFKKIMLLWITAVSIKLLLQAFSVIPALGDLAYGFRPVVIGYLHLVLLGIISLFIIGYCFYCRHLQLSRKTKMALNTFIAGIILNEILLMLQGVANIRNFSIPYINHLLLCAALIMFVGVLNLFLSIMTARI